MTKKKQTTPAKTAVNRTDPATLPFYMPRVAERLIALGFLPGVPRLPGEDREGDFLCRDKSDGEGPYLAKWWADKTPPTLEELEAALQVPAEEPEPEHSYDDGWSN